MRCLRASSIYLILVTRSRAWRHCPRRALGGIRGIRGQIEPILPNHTLSAVALGEFSKLVARRLTEGEKLCSCDRHPREYTPECIA